MNALPFAQLQVLVAVARTGSFSAAARELQVSRSAVSQSVGRLEDQLRMTLVRRTSRSVALTDAGRRLAEAVGPAFVMTASALEEAAASPGQQAGTLRLTVPHAALAQVIQPVLPEFRARHPGVELEIAVDDRMVDVVADGFDAGIRLDESLEGDMVRMRLTEPFRFLVVGSREYLERYGIPETPADLSQHECITFRSPTTGALYAWEFRTANREWKVPVRGRVAVNLAETCAHLAESGIGLAYAAEPSVRHAVETGRLLPILTDFSPSVPGWFIYYPSRVRSPTPLRQFVEVAREVLLRRSPNAAKEPL